MKRLFFLLPLLLLGLDTLFAEVLIDCTEMDYEDVEEWVAGLAFAGSDYIVVSHPFKRLGQTDLVFDPFDRGTVMQQARQTPLYGGESEFESLVATCHENGFSVLVRINPFLQDDGYNLRYFEPKDFTLSSLLYSTNGYLLELSGSGGSKLKDLFDEMNDLPADGWLVDVEDISSEIRSDYESFAVSQLGADNCFLITAPESEEENVVSADYYWDLRSTAFLLPLADVSDLTNEREKSSSIVLVDSTNLTINNAVTVLYLMAEGNDLLLPHAFFDNDYVFQMLTYLDAHGDYQIEVLTDEMFLLHSENSLVSFNLGDDLAVIETEAFIPGVGTFVSEKGSAVITGDGISNSFFLLPRSVYLWDIE